MLAFKKAFIYLKRSSEATMAFIQKPRAELEFGKGEARAWELHQTLCEFVGENCWDFLSVFALCCWRRGSYWVFLAFLASTFPMLRTLLPEVSGVVSFCVRE